MFCFHFFRILTQGNPNFWNSSFLLNVTWLQFYEKRQGYKSISIISGHVLVHRWKNPRLCHNHYRYYTITKATKIWYNSRMEKVRTKDKNLEWEVSRFLKASSSVCIPWCIIKWNFPLCFLKHLVKIVVNSPWFHPIDILSKWSS